MENHSNLSNETQGIVLPSMTGRCMRAFIASCPHTVLGRCDRFAEDQVFWILVTFFQGLLTWSTMLVSVTQFLVISRKRLVTHSGILAVIAVLTVCATFESFCCVCKWNKSEGISVYHGRICCHLFGICVAKGEACD